MFLLLLPHCSLLFLATVTRSISFTLQLGIHPSSSQLAPPIRPKRLPWKSSVEVNLEGEMKVKLLRAALELMK